MPFRHVHKRDAGQLKEFGLEFNASMILGGQIRGEMPRLFSIYAAGNFIEATAETTYFQVGESKYGKPIIDRVLRRSSSLNEAAKCALVSMDSTIQSNLSVGLPLDLVLIKRDRFRSGPSHEHRCQQRVLSRDSLALERGAPGGLCGAPGSGLAADALRLSEPSRGSGSARCSSTAARRCRMQ